MHSETLMFLASPRARFLLSSIGLGDGVFGRMQNVPLTALVPVMCTASELDLGLSHVA